MSNDKMIINRPPKPTVSFTLSEFSIVQIIPADGWIALYFGDDGEVDENLREPVVCFALIEYEQDKKIVREVHPMTQSEAGIDVLVCSNFAGLVKPSAP